MAKRSTRAGAVASPVTLRLVMADYIRIRNLKSSTTYIYSLLVDRYLADWLDKPVGEISKKMVEKRFLQLSETHKAQANHIMRILRALLTFASHAYTDADGNPPLKENPVKHLSNLRAWHKIRRRQTLIKPHQLRLWYAAVLNLDNESIRDYLVFLLFTGLRKSEALSLVWEDVDLEDRSFIVRDTKNGDDHILPISGFLHDLLHRRKGERHNEYVFSDPGTKGNLPDCRPYFKRISTESGVTFSLHDLRRTFLTIAEGLDVQYYVLKRLANHKVSGDVTAGYIVRDVNRLREPMERISQQLLEYCLPRRPSPEVPY